MSSLFSICYIDIKALHAPPLLTYRSLQQIYRFSTTNIPSHSILRAAKSSCLLLWTQPQKHSTIVRTNVKFSSFAVVRYCSSFSDRIQLSKSFRTDASIRRSTNNRIPWIFMSCLVCCLCGLNIPRLLSPSNTQRLNCDFDARLIPRIPKTTAGHSVP